MLLAAERRESQRQSQGTSSQAAVTGKGRDDEKMVEMERGALGKEGRRKTCETWQSVVLGSSREDKK